MCVSLCKFACASTVGAAAQWTGWFTCRASLCSHKYYQFVSSVSFNGIFLVLYILQRLMMPMALFCFRGRPCLALHTNPLPFGCPCSGFYQRTNPIMQPQHESVLTIRLPTKNLITEHSSQGWVLMSDSVNILCHFMPTKIKLLMTKWGFFQ